MSRSDPPFVLRALKIERFPAQTRGTIEAMESMRRSYAIVSGLFRMRTFRALLSAALLALVVPPFAAAVEQPLDGDWVRFSLTGRAYGVAEWGASSVLESEHFWEISRYDPGKAFDRDPATAWVEGAPGPGIGETIVAAFAEYPEALGFINGFARNQNLFERNHRVKTFDVQLYLGVHVDGFATEFVTLYDALPVGSAAPISLADVRAAQRVVLPLDPATATEAMNAFRRSVPIRERSFPQAAMMGIDADTDVPLHFRYILRLEIAEVYRGTTWEDTCIAEIWPDYGEIAHVETHSTRRSLALHTPDGRRVPGYADFEYVLTIVALSDNSEWAIVLKEPAYPGPGRVSSEYAVIHAPTGRDMTASSLAAHPDGSSSAGAAAGFVPIDIVEDAGQIFVVHENVKTGEVRRAAVPRVYH